MSVAADLKGAVKQTFGEYGREMFLRKVTQGTYNQASGKTTGGTSTDYRCIGRIGNYKDSAVDGQRVKRGDRRGTIIPDDSTIMPEEGDEVIVGGTLVSTDVVGGVHYSVVDAQVREIGGASVVHTVQLRGLGVSKSS